MSLSKSIGKSRQRVQPDIHDLTSLLDQVEKLTEKNGELCLEDIIKIVGTRWFGPLLIVPGLVMVVPVVGDIPGVSAMMALVVLLISVQAIFDRSKVWLPRWMARRTVKVDTVKKGIKWLRKPAATVDRHTRRRMTWAVKHSSIYVIAAICCVIAVITPLLEIIPFSVAIAGAALTCFGLALLARDGLIALVAIACSLGTIGMLLGKFVF